MYYQFCMLASLSSCKIAKSSVHTVLFNRWTMMMPLALFDVSTFVSSLIFSLIRLWTVWLQFARFERSKIKRYINAVLCFTLCLHFCFLIEKITKLKKVSLLEHVYKGQQIFWINTENASIRDYLFWCILRAINRGKRSHIGKEVSAVS